MAGQVWATDSLGGFMYSNQLSDILRNVAQPLERFRQFCDAKDASMGGKSKGATFTWNIYNNVAAAGTVLVETTTIAKTTYTIAQGTLTMSEWGNSVDYSGKLDDLSFHPVKEIVTKVLKNDAASVLDSVAYAEFNKAPLVYVPQGTASHALTTNGTATATATSQTFNKWHARNIQILMKERNIPGYMGDDYMCVAKPSFFQTLRGELETVHQYTTQGFGLIMNGEIGRFEGIRFVEQTQQALTMASSGGEAFFFGEDTVAEAVAVPLEVRGKIPQDYGRDRGVAWYYLGGFAIVHNASMSTVANSRVLKWTSKA